MEILLPIQVNIQTYLGTQATKHAFPQQVEILPQSGVLNSIDLKRLESAGRRPEQRFYFQMFFRQWIQPIHGAHHLNHAGVDLARVAGRCSCKRLTAEGRRALDTHVPRIVVLSFETQEVALLKCNSRRLVLRFFGCGGVQSNAVNVLPGMHQVSKGSTGSLRVGCEDLLVGLLDWRGPQLGCRLQGTCRGQKRGFGADRCLGEFEKLGGEL